MTQYDCSPPKSEGSGGNGSDEAAARKERVLHTRIPESLDEAIRAAASELGMSVSNLVRNVLANTLSMVEAATLHTPARAAAAAAAAKWRGAGGPGAGAGAAAGTAAGAGPYRTPDLEASEAAIAADHASAPEPASAPIAARVLGWQEATLNLNAVCDRCNAILARGSRGAISIPDPATAPRAIRCLPCLEELTRDPADPL